MLDKKCFFRFLTVLILLLPTLVVVISKSWLDLNRALFVYEYFFLLIILCLNLRFYFSWAYFILIFLLDISSVFSKIYLFNLQDFFYSLKYFFDYSINITQFIIVLVVIFYFIFLLFIFKRIKQEIGNDKFLVKIFVFVFTIIFSLDNLNGSSFLFKYNSNLNFYSGNFASNLTQPLFYNFINKSKNSSVPELLQLNNRSTTFKQFSLDTSGNQLLVIVESFGLIEDSLKRFSYQQFVSDKFKSRHWKVSWGKLFFLVGLLKLN